VPLRVREVIRKTDGAGGRLVQTSGDHCVCRSSDERLTTALATEALRPDWKMRGAECSPTAETRQIPVELPV
jgi:hypothetical protein